MLIFNLSLYNLIINYFLLKNTLYVLYFPIVQLHIDIFIILTNSITTKSTTYFHRQVHTNACRTKKIEGINFIIPSIFI